LPHIGVQSLSVLAFAPGGQQPSPPRAAVIAVVEQTASHVLAEPSSFPGWHASALEHEVEQLPSHNSPRSFTPFPQTALQSLSTLAFAPSGQQLSPFFGVVIF
jgi:hypothetical protein